MKQRVRSVREVVERGMHMRRSARLAPPHEQPPLDRPSGRARPPLPSSPVPPRCNHPRPPAAAPPMAPQQSQNRQHSANRLPSRGNQPGKQVFCQATAVKADECHQGGSGQLFQLQLC